ncbi:hypothetical protein AKO1_010899 [Acrasis kona]|uniref:Uncharacterized protein n=1 Tax=Acrasis kona TaxID=1008807 RepID=A0AAW2YGF2_9EUKA
MLQSLIKSQKCQSQLRQMIIERDVQIAKKKYELDQSRRALYNSISRKRKSQIIESYNNESQHEKMKLMDHKIKSTNISIPQELLQKGKEIEEFEQYISNKPKVQFSANSRQIAQDIIDEFDRENPHLVPLLKFDTNGIELDQIHSIHDDDHYEMFTSSRPLKKFKRNHELFKTPSKVNSQITHSTPINKTPMKTPTRASSSSSSTPSKLVIGTPINFFSPVVSRVQKYNHPNSSMNDSSMITTPIKSNPIQLTPSRNVKSRIENRYQTPIKSGHQPPPLGSKRPRFDDDDVSVTPAKKIKNHRPLVIGSAKKVQWPDGFDTIVESNFTSSEDDKILLQDDDYSSAFKHSPHHHAYRYAQKSSLKWNAQNDVRRPPRYQ